MPYNHSNLDETIMVELEQQQALDSYNLDETHTSSYETDAYDLDEMYGRTDTSYETLAYKHYA